MTLPASLIEEVVVGLGLTGNADKNVRLREVMAALEVGVVWLADGAPGDESRQRTVSIMLAGLVAYLRDDDAERPRPALRLVKGDDDQPEPEA